MRKKLFMNMKAFVLVLGYVLLMSTAHAMQPAGQPALTDAQIDQIVQEADDIVRNDVVSDAQMNQFDQEIQAIIDDLAAHDPRPLGEFQNAVLVEARLAEVNLDDKARMLGGGPYRGYERRPHDKMIAYVTQVTGHHLLQVIFMTARCGLDYAFLKQLKKYYFQNVLSDWETKTQQILEALICIEQDEEGELLWDNNAQKLVQDAFTTTFAPDEATTFKAIMLLGLYFIASECYRNAEHQMLSMPWTGLIDFATRQAKNIEQSDKDGKIVMPIPTMLLYLADTWGLGGESIVAENLPVVRNWTLRFSGYYHEVLNTYWFEAAKRSLILARFSMQTRSYFQTQTKLFVQNNKDKLCALASSLAQARATNNQEMQKEIEARFKLFIAESYDYPFFQWLRFKGNCIFWTTIWTEMLLMLPAMIEGGKLIYEFVRP